MFKIDYFRLFKTSLFLAFIYSVVFFAIIFVSTIILGLTDESRTKNSVKHFKVIKILTKVLISSFVPFVGLFALTETQFSSLVNLTVLITIATFIYKKF